MFTKLTSVVIAILLSCAMVLGQDQERAEVYRVAYHEAVKGKNAELEKAIKDKTEKFNKASVDRITTWSVMSGPRSGEYARVIGPKDWTYFEKDNQGGQYWQQNVVPLIAKSSGVEFSVRMKDMSYNGSGKTTTTNYVDIWEFTMEAGSIYDWTSWMRDLVRMCNENKSKARFSTHRMVSGTSGNKYIIVWGMDSLAEFDDSSENWPQWFNKMKGSSSAWPNELKRAQLSSEIYGQSRYMMRYVPELSSK